VIEDNCIIGLRSTIFPNVRIGRNSVVAAGSLVINDVPPNSIVMGVPARSFGSMDKYREKCLQRWAEQRPPDVTFGKGESWWNSPHAAAKRLRLREHLLTVFRNQLQPEGSQQISHGSRGTVESNESEPQGVRNPEVSTTI
jgi:hypothetical protein